MEPCFVIRGGVTVYSVGKDSAVAQEEISSVVFDILESEALEDSLIDVVGVTSLRDPVTTPPASSPNQIPTNPITTPPASSPNQVPTGSSTQPLLVAPTLMPIRTPPPVTFLFPTDSSGVESDGSLTPTSQPTSTVEEDEKKPWILRFPWWGWLLIALGVVFLLALKVAYDKYQQQKDSSAESNDGNGDIDLDSRDGGNSNRSS